MLHVSTYVYANIYGKIFTPQKLRVLKQKINVKLTTTNPRIIHLTSRRFVFYAGRTIMYACKSDVRNMQVRYIHIVKPL